MIRFKHSARVIMAAAMLLLSVTVLADDRAGQIKAAFIYNFAKFVEWPLPAFKSDTAPLRLCALGGAEKDARLDLINGRLAQGHAIELETIKAADKATHCHILYISGTVQEPSGPVLASLAEQGVLTISDDINFVNDGGMVSLYIDNDHVRFSVNLKNAQRGGLKLSARILQLAQEVRTQ